MFAHISQCFRLRRLSESPPGSLPGDLRGGVRGACTPAVRNTRHSRVALRTTSLAWPIALRPTGAGPLLIVNAVVQTYEVAYLIHLHCSKFKALMGFHRTRHTLVVLQ